MTPPVFELKTDSIWVKITHDVLNPRETEEWCTTDEVGSVIQFVGTTRNNFEGRIVTRLEYESDEQLALHQLQEICEETIHTFTSSSSSSSTTSSSTSSSTPHHIRICMHHRLGLVQVREASILCCVSSPHRKEGFKMCEHLMNDLKAKVAIWKKECFEDGGSLWKENIEQFQV